MNIVFPMAGLGTRFSNSGFTLPKPLIQVDKKPMYRHAVDCMPLHLATKVLFILRDSPYISKIKFDIYKHYDFLKDYSIITLTHETQGQAETVLKSTPYLNLNEPTLIHNCDTWIKENFSWTELLKKDIDGAIVLFFSTEPRWSYARLDENNSKITDFQEKKVISTHASTGTYFFRNTPALISSLNHIIHQNVRENNEFYLSTVYQLMLESRKIIEPLWTKDMLCFGTPQDLVDSLNILLNRQSSE